SRWLVEEMSYERTQIRTRPQWRVPKSPGSARSSGWPCDIVVFQSTQVFDQPLGIRAIFEIKAPSKLSSAKETEHAERELKQYLQNEQSASIGVLTNGVDVDSVMRVFYKFFKDGAIHWRELRAFPRAGEPPDLGTRTLRRRDLQRAPNLKQLFKDIRNY